MGYHCVCIRTHVCSPSHFTHISMTKIKHIIVPIAITIAIGIIVTIYYLFDPSTNLFPQCLFYQLTGWECIGCGSQRMVHALLHGDFVAAWHYNPAIIVVSPILLVMLIASYLRNIKPRFYNVVYSPWVVWTVIGGLLAWGVLRNIF